MGVVMYSRGSVMWPVRAEAATVRGLARKTLLDMEPMRPGKLRLVVEMQTSELLRRPKVSEGPPRQAEQPLRAHVAAGIAQDVFDGFSLGPLGTPRRLSFFMSA